MVSLDTAYSQAKAALLDDVRTAGDSCWQRWVPATPDWRVLDVVAHVTGIAADAARGAQPSDLDLLEQFRDASVARARDHYAESQVVSRRGRAPLDVVGEWDAVEPDLLVRLAPDCPADLRLPLGFDAVVVVDLCVHADDVAGALGVPPHVGSAASGVALASYCFGVDYRIRALGLPALCLRYGSRERVLGEGSPAAMLTADRWELVRLLAGRRSRDQIRSLDWDGDPEPYLALLPAYGERADALVEADGSGQAG